MRTPRLAWREVYYKTDYFKDPPSNLYSLQLKNGSRVTTGYLVG